MDEMKLEAIIRECVSVLTNPATADHIVMDALARWHLDVPCAGSAVQMFIDGPVHAAVEDACGPEIAAAVAEEARVILAPLIAAKGPQVRSSLRPKERKSLPAELSQRVEAAVAQAYVRIGESVRAERASVAPVKPPKRTRTLKMGQAKSLSEQWFEAVDDESAPEETPPRQTRDYLENRTVLSSVKVIRVGAGQKAPTRKLRPVRSTAPKPVPADEPTLVYPRSDSKPRSRSDDDTRPVQLPRRGRDTDRPASRGRAVVFLSQQVQSVSALDRTWGNLPVVGAVTAASFDQALMLLSRPLVVFDCRSPVLSPTALRSRAKRCGRIILWGSREEVNRALGEAQEPEGWIRCDADEVGDIALLVENICARLAA